MRSDYGTRAKRYFTHAGAGQKQLAPTPLCAVVLLDMHACSSD